MSISLAPPRLCTCGHLFLTHKKLGESPLVYGRCKVYQCYCAHFMAMKT